MHPTGEVVDDQPNDLTLATIKKRFTVDKVT